MKRVLRWLAGIVGGVILLVVLVVVAIYLPPVQNFVVKRVAQVASEATGMEIGVERVRLAFPLDLRVEGVLVVKTNERTLERDTLARIASVGVGVELKPLFHSEVKATELKLVDVQFDTSDLIAQVVVSGRAEEICLRGNDVCLDADSIVSNYVLLERARVDIHLIDTIVAADTTETENLWKVAVARLEVKDSRVALYDPDYSLSGLSITADSVYYCADELRLKDVSLFTPNSYVQVVGRMDMNAFDEDDPGVLTAWVKGEVGREDLLQFLADLPQDFLSAYPYQSLSVDAMLSGNMNHLDVNSLSASLPTVFVATAQGFVGNLYDVDHLLANLTVNVETQDVNALVGAFLDADTRGMITIPAGATVRGDVSIDGNIYRGELLLTDGVGRATIDATCEVAMDNSYPDIAYAADVSTTHLKVGRFVKGLDLSALSMKANVKGAGTDFFDRRTYVSGDVALSEFTIGDFDLAGSTATINLDKQVANVSVHSVNEIVSGELSVDALLSADDVKGTLACELDNIDLYKLGVAQVPLTTSLCAHVDVESNMKENHSVQGFVSDILIKDSTDTYRAYDLEIDAFTRKDTTQVNLSSGDLDVRLSASGGYEMLASVGGNLTDELMREIDRKYISQDTLLRLLPIGSLRMTSGRDNFAYGYAKRLGYDFKEVNIDITCSPTEGINGYARVDSLVAYGLEVDHLRLDLRTEDDVFHYAINAKNEVTNPKYSFTLQTDGDLFATGSNLRIKLFDKEDSLGVDLGLSASLVHDGILVSLADEESILGYEKFRASTGNYVFLADNGRLSANLELSTERGTSIGVYTNDVDKDALQDITLAINNLDLAPIFAIVPYCPKMKGVLTGDFHATMNKDDFSLNASVGVDNFEYEDIDMGNLYVEFAYAPQDNNTHYVDGTLNHNGNDVGAIRGTYTVGEQTDLLDADVSLTRLPLNLANGFIPDQIVGLKGYGDGQLKLEGALSEIQINGKLDLDSAYLVSVPYGIELNIDDRPIEIKDSKVLLEDFRLYSHNESPLVVDGEVDFTDLANMTTRLRMTASNWLVIDAKENRKSEAFGKAYVNLDALATGPLASLKIIGSVDVLGNTDLTYVLRDSPISTDNELEGLVQFTDLSTEEETVVVRPTVEGPYIDLRLSVAQTARVFVALNAIKTNYIDMTGGGDLRMIYSQNDIRLTGRYTIEEGTMKYSLPVIPLKTFTIAEGSYVEFTGEVMNPTLSITATETTKSNALVNGVNQTVTFNCGVSISQTLEQMGLEFVISAPENMTIDSELQAMSTDERSKVAVTLLTTGMYLSDNSLSSFSMNSALSSFLQNEINNISSNALRTLDLSIGIDNTTDAVGASHTDYTFKFAKRLWNNRIRIVVGGKVSSNNASVENLFDNISFEYRLDKNAYTNLRLFYDRSTYDYLEGYVGQYGVGLLWRRQVQSLKDLFRKERLYTDTITVERDAVESVPIAEGKEDEDETVVE